MVTGMDIDNSGKFLITTSTDHCLRLYDCLEAKFVFSIIQILQQTAQGFKQNKKDNRM